MAPFCWPHREPRHRIKKFTCTRSYSARWRQTTRPSSPGADAHTPWPQRVWTRCPSLPGADAHERCPQATSARWAVGPSTGRFSSSSWRALPLSSSIHHTTAPPRPPRFVFVPHHRSASSSSSIAEHASWICEIYQVKFALLI
jgi:hypothetical protein